MTVCGTGSGIVNLPNDPSFNTPTISARSVLNGIEVSWSYPTVNPHAVAHTLLYKNRNNDLSGAAEIAVVDGNRYTDQSEMIEGATYYYWIRMVSVNGTIGGPIGPASAIYASTVTNLLDILENEILESSLAIELREKLDGIYELSKGLTDEAAERLKGNDYFAGLLSQLQGQVDGVGTLLSNEIIDRSDADSALLSQINILLAVANENAAAIIRVDEVFAGKLIAYATTTETLIAAMGEAANQFTIGAIETEKTVTVERERVIIEYAEELTGRAQADAQNYADGAILTERNLRINADDVLMNQINLMTGKVYEDGKLYVDGAILAESNLRINADGVLANQINTLNGAVGNNQAAVNNILNLTVSPYSALAQKLSSIEATAGGATAAASQALTATAGIDGLKASYVVKTDVNGHVSGFGLHNEAGTSNFIINVDRFAIGNAALTVVPFFVQNNQVFIRSAVIGDASIGTAKIKDLAVNTLKIGYNAVTVPGGASIPAGSLPAMASVHLTGLPPYISVIAFASASANIGGTPSTAGTSAMLSISVGGNTSSSAQILSSYSASASLSASGIGRADASGNLTVVAILSQVGTNSLLQSNGGTVIALGLKR